MEKALLKDQMVIYTLEILMIIKQKELENLYKPMEKYMMDNGLIIKEMELVH